MQNKFTHFRRCEGRVVALDGVAVHADFVAFDTDQVEIVRLPTHSRRKPGSRMYLKNRVPSRPLRKGGGTPGVQMT